MIVSTCPTCRKTVPDQPPLPDPFPFCSKRCKLVDLGRWFNGDYSIERDIQPDDVQPDDVHPDDAHPDDVHPDDMHPDDADSAEPSTAERRNSPRKPAKWRSDGASE